MKGLIDKLLLEYVGLPQVLDLAVHLVNFFGWISQGGHSEPLLLLALFLPDHSFMLKSLGGGVVVAHVILVSALGPNPSFFLFLGDFYSTWDRG